MSLQLGIPLTLAAALIQAVILPRLRVYGGQPDLVVIIVLAWSVFDNGLEGMAWAFVGGLFLDLFSGAPLGISSLALVPITYLVGQTEAQMYRSNILMPILLAGGGAIAYHVIYVLALNFLAGMTVAWLLVPWYVTLPSLFFDAILLLPTLRVLRQWYDKLHPHQVKI